MQEDPNSRVRDDGREEKWGERMREGGMGVQGGRGGEG